MAAGRQKGLTYDIEGKNVVAYDRLPSQLAWVYHLFTWLLQPTAVPTTYTIYVSIKLRGLLVFSLRHVTNFNWSNWKNLDRLDFLIFFIKCIWYKELSGWLSMIMQIYEWNPTCLYCLAAFSRFHLLQQTLNCTNLQRSA